MKVGTVKKMIIMAEGFAYNDSLEAFYMQGSTWIYFKHIQAWEFYPILLSRAVEGWNKKNDPYDVAIDCKSLLHCGKNNRTIVKHFDDYQKTDYLTPQEQAIEAFLIELLEIKITKEQK